MFKRIVFLSLLVIALTLGVSPNGEKVDITFLQTESSHLT
ncbi:hypothetical protein J32TS2_00710 [Shouchella clausii]|nr:hypothetical protein J32TS2_00710 [Shouchella clausii]